MTSIPVRSGAGLHLRGRPRDAGVALVGGLAATVKLITSAVGAIRHDKTRPLRSPASRHAGDDRHGRSAPSASGLMGAVRRWAMAVQVALSGRSLEVRPPRTAEPIAGRLAKVLGTGPRNRGRSSRTRATSALPPIADELGQRPHGRRAPTAELPYSIAIAALRSGVSVKVCTLDVLSPRSPLATVLG